MCAPETVGDDLAAPQVFYPEPQVAIALVRLKECGVGELAEGGAARCRINEVSPVALTLQCGTDVLCCKDELKRWHY